MTDVVIGIDIGTSSTKAVAVSAHGVAHIMETFALVSPAGAGADPTQPRWRIVAAGGGGTNSLVWTQIVSDVTAQTQLVPDQSVIDPPPDPGGRYETLFETYLSLYPATRELVGRLG
jgi:sugar (pentulose or hexulose) kinase